MKHEIREFYEDYFLRDIDGFALYVYLCTILNANERLFISLKETSVKSGFSPRKIKAILSRLKNLGLIKYKILNNRGVQLAITNPLLMSFDTGLGQNSQEPMSYGTGCLVKSSRPVSSVTGLGQNSQEPMSYDTGLTRTKKPRYLSLDLKSSSSSNLQFETSIETKLETKSRTPARKPRPKAKKIPYQPEDLELGKKWHQYALSEMKWSTAPGSWCDEFFATGIALVKRRAGLNHQQMTKIYEFVRNDNFWSGNALSPKTLLNKSSRNDLRKIDNIIQAIRARNPSMKQLEKVIDATEEDKAKADRTLMMLQNPEEYFRRNMND